MYGLTTFLDVDVDLASHHLSHQSQRTDSPSPPGVYHDNLIRFLAAQRPQFDENTGEAAAPFSPQSVAPEFEVPAQSHFRPKPATGNDDGLMTAAWAVARVATTTPIVTETPPTEFAQMPAGFQILLNEEPSGLGLVSADANIEADASEWMPPSWGVPEAFTQMLLQPAHASEITPQIERGTEVFASERFEQAETVLTAGPSVAELSSPEPTGDGPPATNGLQQPFDANGTLAVGKTGSQAARQLNAMTAGEAPPDSEAASASLDSSTGSAIAAHGNSEQSAMSSLTGDAERPIVDPDSALASRPQSQPEGERLVPHATARPMRSAETSGRAERSTDNGGHTESEDQRPTFLARDAQPSPHTDVAPTGAAPTGFSPLAPDTDSTPIAGASANTSSRPITEPATKAIAEVTASTPETVEPTSRKPAASLKSTVAGAPSSEVSSVDVESSFASVRSQSIDSDDAAQTSQTTSESPRRESELNRFVDRLAASVRQANDGGSRLQIRLNPPELGSMQIEVSTRDGTIAARLQVQTAAAHRAVLDNLTELRDALAHNGTTIERIDVHLSEAARRDQTSDGSRREGGDPSPDEQQQSGRQKSRDQPREEAPPRRRQADRASNLDELDIEV